MPAWIGGGRCAGRSLQKYLRPQELFDRPPYGELWYTDDTQMTISVCETLIAHGRGQDSDIRIASHFVSRVHAKISTSGAATVIEDAGSKNGILVNSERVQRRVLRHGDVVNIGGELNLKFVDAMH